MKKNYLGAWLPLTLILCLYGCARKKSTTPASAVQQPNATAIATGPNQPAATPTGSQQPSQSAATPEAKPQLPAPSTPPDQQSFEITTQAGFLGKSADPTSQSKKLMQHAAKNFEKNADTFSKQMDLTFFVQNVSGSSLFVANFAYIKPRRFTRWRWRKSAVQEIKSKEKISMSVRSVEDYADTKHIFGALAVFPNRPEAESSTYELLHDENKLDLDSILALQGKTVIIGVERYGFKEPFYDYDFVETKEDPKKNSQGIEQELDFFVQNKIGRPVFVTGFIYSKKAKGKWIAAEDAKDDMTVWRFYKTKVLQLENDQTGYIDVDSIIPKRDRNYVRGYLGVFDENHEEEAHNKTFELLSDQEKITLGPLSRRQGTTIILEVERYGVANDVIDFTVKPIKWIDFTKIVH